MASTRTTPHGAQGHALAQPPKRPTATKTIEWAGGTLALLATLAALAGCAAGPDYKVPAAASTPVAFKEAEGWKAAAPSDAMDRGTWWKIFQDPFLDEIETQVAVANQSILQATANYEAARQFARSDRTGYLPSISALASAARATSGSKSSSTGSSVANTYSASLSGTWDLDVWGRLQRLTESDLAVAQADAALLASLRLSLQSTVASDYIVLRSLDARRQLLKDAVVAYGRTLEISQNKYKVGVAAKSDVVSAQAQLDSARAQEIDATVQRAQLEHAIAVLTGRMPASFSIPVRTSLALTLPSIPPVLASELLERRPDVAEAERLVASANAKIGVQTAAYFPSLVISASGGYTGSPLSHLFTAPFKFWSLGAQASDALLDWGQRHDQVLAARATYEGTVASYRGTVLTAFQQVEDGLSNARILAQEAEIQSIAVTEAAEAAKIALNEYRAGTVDYTTVATAQVTELNDRETALTLLQNRLTSDVALIVALGGGWNTKDLPSSKEVFASSSQDPAAVSAVK